MYKPLAKLVGQVSGLAPAAATAITVSDAYAAYVAANLSAGDWTYVAVRTGGSIEHLKVTGAVGNVLSVQRGMDSTDALALVPGTELTPVIGNAAIQDLLDVRALAPALVLTGSGAITVTPITGGFDVSTPEIDVYSSDASLSVSGSAGSFDLGVNVSTIGCCTASSGELPT